MQYSLGRARTDKTTRSDEVETVLVIIALLATFEMKVENVTFKWGVVHNSIIKLLIIADTPT
jgi:hypothetical protein